MAGLVDQPQTYRGWQGWLQHVAIFAMNPLECQADPVLRLVSRDASTSVKLYHWHQWRTTCALLQGLPRPQRLTTVGSSSRNTWGPTTKPGRFDFGPMTCQLSLARWISGWMRPPARTGLPGCEKSSSTSSTSRTRILTWRGGGRVRSSNG